jgi:hypothetical protein
VALVTELLRLLPFTGNLLYLFFMFHPRVYSSYDTGDGEVSIAASRVSPWELPTNEGGTLYSTATNTQNVTWSVFVDKQNHDV